MKVVPMANQRTLVDLSVLRANTQNLIATLERVLAGNNDAVKDEAHEVIAKERARLTALDLFEEFAKTIPGACVIEARTDDVARCSEPGCGNAGTRTDGMCAYHTLQGPCIGGCEHDWTNVVDVCKDKPCNGQILGRKCARCGEFDGSRVNRPLA